MAILRALEARGALPKKRIAGIIIVLIPASPSKAPELGQGLSSVNNNLFLSCAEGSGWDSWDCWHDSFPADCSVASARCSWDLVSSSGFHKESMLQGQEGEREGW